MFFSNFLEKRKKAKEEKLINFCKEVIRTGRLKKSYYGGMLYIENEQYRPHVCIEVASCDEGSFHFEHEEWDIVNRSSRYDLLDPRNNDLHSVLRARVTFTIGKGDSLFPRLLQEKKEAEKEHLFKMINMKTEEIMKLKNEFSQIEKEILEETQRFNEKKTILKDVTYSHTLNLKENDKMKALEKQKNIISFQIRQAERALQQPESIVIH